MLHSDQQLCNMQHNLQRLHAVCFGVPPCDSHILSAVQHNHTMFHVLADDECVHSVQQRILSGDVSVVSRLQQLGHTLRHMQHDSAYVSDV